MVMVKALRTDLPQWKTGAADTRCVVTIDRHPVAAARACLPIGATAVDAGRGILDIHDQRQSVEFLDCGWIEQICEEAGAMTDRTDGYRCGG